jgi:hypothetical protein
VESDDGSVVDLFEDEVRSFVHADDVSKVIRTLGVVWKSPENGSNNTPTSAGVAICRRSSDSSVGITSAQLTSLWRL